jgi:MoaA/NifB/PqqE/SkfB family radical SAM enzyme
LNPFLNACLYKYVYHKPVWPTGPEVLQMELHNYCNVDCVYCNVKNFHCGKQGVASREHVETVMRQVSGTVKEFRPFLNNEASIIPEKEEISLTKSLQLAKDILQCRTVIYSNGTIVENKHLFIDKNLDELHLTISAGTSATYEKVHRRPLFRKALETYNYFKKHKFSHQKLFVHFVMVKENLDELSLWKRLFNDAEQVVSPLHDGLNQNASKECLKDLDYKATIKESTLKGKMACNMPCTLWNNLSVSCFGDLLQCCDAPYSFNYGKVGEVNALVAWRKRLLNGMNNEACRACVLKNKRWREILEEYVPKTKCNAAILTEACC